MNIVQTKENFSNNFNFVLISMATFSFLLSIFDYKEIFQNEN